jgi:hypothetical protein
MGMGLLNMLANEPKTKWHIQGWTGRILWDGKTFDSFEEGWEWIYTNDPMPENAEENYYDDYYVESVA